jgi:hypothetical protein
MDIGFFSVPLANPSRWFGLNGQVPVFIGQGKLASGKSGFVFCN